MLVSAAILLALAAPAQAAFPGQNGKIAFTTSQAGGYQLETIEPDGAGRAPLFSGLHPAWSPDGARLAFDDGNDVFTARPDGTDRVQLTVPAPCIPGYPCVSIRDDPSWAPDGRRLTLHNTYCDLGGCFAWISVIPGFGNTSIASNGYRPAWSPNGSVIAFDLNGGIATVPPTGGDYLQLTHGSRDYHANWSPDGTKIVFARSDGIWVMNADGSDQTQIFNDPEVGGPAWSPDGSKIVFSRGEAGQADLYTINPDGTGETNITETPNVSEFAPDWQPLLGPQRVDYKNAAQFCKAEREFFGDETFRNLYGGGANAHGKCVSGR